MIEERVAENGHLVGDTNYSTGLSLAGMGLKNLGTMVSIRFKTMSL
ncbi:MAG: hypothetical protein AAF391_01210 [Bacteroidota bacterium]